MRYFLSILFLFVSSLSFGQYESSSNKKADKYFRQAKYELGIRDFDEAKRLFEKAIAKDPSFVGAYMQLATIYQMFGKGEEKVSLYEKVLELEGGTTPYFQIYFDLAKHALGEGKYDDVKKFCKLYLASKATNKTKRGFCEEINENAEFALKSIQNPKKIEPVKLPYPLNEFDLQYFPSLNVDGSEIYFTRRLSSKPESKEDIYFSEKLKDNSWSEPKSISNRINKQGENEGTCAISTDGNTLIFTSCGQNKNNFGRCDLFVSYKKEGKWTKPENLGKNVNTEYWESQPTLSFDGRILYFVSDRPNGFGGRDIYKSYKIDDENWSKATNVGSVINTKKDDIGPFLHPSGDRLILASDGRLGMGGFDLYYSVKSQEYGEWSEPKHFGYPINNHKDQISLVILSDNSKAFYSEDQKEGKAYYSYIYSFSLPNEFKPQKRENYLVGHILDSKTKKPIEAELRLMNIKSDSLITSTHSDPITGKYSIVLKEGQEYALFISSPSHLFKSIHLSDLNMTQEKGVELDFSLESVVKNASVDLQNIFFKTAKYSLKEKSQTELKQVATYMKENPNLKVEISGHTDNVGDEQFNFELSMKRAKSVVDFLIKQGVSKESLRYIGHGQTKHIDTNETKEGRQKNRRIEFKILSF